MNDTPSDVAMKLADAIFDAARIVDIPTRVHIKGLIDQHVRQQVEQLQTPISDERLAELQHLRSRVGGRRNLADDLRGALHASEKFAMAAYDELPALLEELRQLRETVGKLRKLGWVTADGVVVVPGDYVWSPAHHPENNPRPMTPMRVQLDDGAMAVTPQAHKGFVWHVSQCYSTKAAAEAAKEQVQ